MNYTVVITLLITLIFPYIHCFVMLWYSYIDIIATLAIPVNYGHANKVFIKKTKKNKTQRRRTTSSLKVIHQ